MFISAATQAALDAAINKNIKFSDIFEIAEPKGSPPVCPPGFQRSNQPSLIYSVTDPSTYATYFLECLKVWGARRGALVVSACMHRLTPRLAHSG